MKRGRGGLSLAILDTSPVIFFLFFKSIIVPASFQQFNRILAVLSAMENKQQKLFESLRKNEAMRLFEQSLK